MSRVPHTITLRPVTGRLAPHGGGEICSDLISVVDTDQKTVPQCSSAISRYNDVCVMLITDV